MFTRLPSPLPLTPFDGSDSPGSKVLVLDDSAGQRGMLLAMLRRWGLPAIATGDPVVLGHGYETALCAG